MCFVVSQDGFENRVEKYYLTVLHILQGVSVCSDMVYGRPEVVKLVHDSNLLLVTWGKENSKEECVTWQKQQAEGIVIISDK